MPSKKHQPIHPGEVLQHDFLEPLGITAYRLGKETGISSQHIGRIVHGTRGITADVALRFARFFGTSPTLWMNLQARYDLDTVEDSNGKEIKKRIQPYEAA